MGVILVRASLNSTNYRTKLGQVEIFDVLPAGTGISPNGNTPYPGNIDFPPDGNNFFRNVLTVRNIRELFVPGATDLLYYDYFDNPFMTFNGPGGGFPLEPGTTIDLESPQGIFFASATANNIPTATDQGEF